MQASASGYQNSLPIRSFAIGGSITTGSVVVVVDDASEPLLTNLIYSDNCKKGGGGRISVLHL